ncbi:MAG: DUF2254 domain-containing protein [Verrucomicrobiales bacterium]
MTLVKVTKIWDSFRSSYWFIPGLITGLMMLLYLAASELEGKLDFKEFGLGRLFWQGGPEEARQVLSTIASSTITVAGVIFSITIVALAQASSQFGPRLLRTYMRDVSSQVVLGTFIGTFIYCLLVLRTVHEGANRVFVPHISVTLAVGLAVISLAMLIYYIHHICDSIQAENLVAAVGRELQKDIKQQFPELAGPEQIEEIARQQEERKKMIAELQVVDTVKAPASGYLQAIDLEMFQKIAEKNDCVFHLTHNPGDFIAEGDLIVESAKKLSEEDRNKLGLSFLTGRKRTPLQDIDFQVHQLVEIAVRALSPGINDPFTAITCVDWLGAGLAQVAKRRLPTGILRDAGGAVRVIYQPPLFDRVLDAAFHQLRQHGASNVAVVLRLLETLLVLRKTVIAESEHQAVLAHAEWIYRHSRKSWQAPVDKKLIRDRYLAVKSAKRVIE